MVGVMNQQHEGAFKNLLIVDSVRGPHSTGMLVVTSAGSTSFVKASGDPFELIGKSAYTNSLRYVNNVLMGHNRYATKGAINKANAHPFEFSNIIGAHNGTLTTQYLLDDHTDFDVDSENLYYHLNQNTLDDTTSKLGGAYALTWYDKRDGTMNFLRNEERTLFYTFSTDNKTLYWASEVWMLEGILGKAGLAHTEVKPFEPFDHYKIEVKPGIISNAKELAGFTVTPVQRRVIPVPTKYKKEARSTTSVSTLGSYIKEKLGKLVGKKATFYIVSAKVCNGTHYLDARCSESYSAHLRIYAPYKGMVWNKLMRDAGDFTGTVKKITSNGDSYHGIVDIRSIKEVPFEDIPFSETEVELPMYTGFEDAELTEAEWREATSGCCAWCGDPAHLPEHNDIVWLGKKEFVCEHCSKEDSVRAYL